MALPQAEPFVEAPEAELPDVENLPPLYARGRRGGIRGRKPVRAETASPPSHQGPFPRRKLAADNSNKRIRGDFRPAGEASPPLAGAEGPAGGLS